MGPLKFCSCRNVCPFSFFSHRSFQPSVGDVAADRHVLVVFAGVKWHRFEATVCDGLLPAGALHAVHMDGTGAFRRRGRRRMQSDS